MKDLSVRYSDLDKKVYRCRVKSFWLGHGALTGFVSLASGIAAGKGLLHSYLEIETYDDDVWYIAQHSYCEGQKNDSLLELTPCQSQDDVLRRALEINARFLSGSLEMKMTFEGKKDNLRLDWEGDAKHVRLREIKSWMLNSYDGKYNFLKHNCQDFTNAFAKYFNLTLKNDDFSSVSVGLSKSSIVTSNRLSLYANKNTLLSSGIADLCGARTTGGGVYGVDVSGLSVCGAKAAGVSVAAVDVCGTRATGVSAYGASASLASADGASASAVRADVYRASGASASVVQAGLFSISGAKASVVDANLVSACGGKVSVFSAKVAGAETGAGLGVCPANLCLKLGIPVVDGTSCNIM